MIKTPRGVEDDDVEDDAMKTMMSRKRLWKHDCDYGNDGHKEYMKRIRNIEMETLRISRNTKKKIQRTMENTETWMKTIGNREKEDGDDKKHKGRDENCRKHRQNNDYNDKKCRDRDVEDDKKAQR